MQSGGCGLQVPPAEELPAGPFFMYQVSRPAAGPRCAVLRCAALGPLLCCAVLGPPLHRAVLSLMAHPCRDPPQCPAVLCCASVLCWGVHAPANRLACHAPPWNVVTMLVRPHFAPPRPRPPHTHTHARAHTHTHTRRLQEYVALMMACWSREPEARPKFDGIVQQLGCARMQPAATHAWSPGWPASAACARGVFSCRLGSPGRRHGGAAGWAAAQQRCLLMPEGAQVDAAGDNGAPWHGGLTVAAPRVVPCRSILTSEVKQQQQQAAAAAASSSMSMDGSQRVRGAGGWAGRGVSWLDDPGVPVCQQHRRLHLLLPPLFGNVCRHVSGVFCMRTPTNRQLAPPVPAGPLFEQR